MSQVSRRFDLAVSIVRIRRRWLAKCLRDVYYTMFLFSSLANNTVHHANRPVTVDMKGQLQTESKLKLFVFKRCSTRVHSCFMLGSMEFSALDNAHESHVKGPLAFASESSLPSLPVATFT